MKRHGSSRSGARRILDKLAMDKAERLAHQDAADGQVVGAPHTQAERAGTRERLRAEIEAGKKGGLK